MNKISKSETGFSAVELVLVIVIVALLGVVGWLVYKDRYKSTPAYFKQSASSTSTTNSALAAKPSLTLDSNKVPQGYAVEVNDPSSQVALNNSTNGCSVTITKTTDSTAKSSNATAFSEQQEQLGQQSAQGKGYAVVQRPASTLTIATSIGQKQLSTFESTSTLMSPPNTIVSRNAYVVQDGYYFFIQVECGTQADLATTNQALLAITLNY